MSIYDQDLTIHDLAEIVANSDRSEIRSNVLRYISKLNRSCPTQGCRHDLHENACNCFGYVTSREIARREGRDTKVLEINSNPIVIDVFCFTFGRLSSGKEPCKVCSEGGYLYKAASNGLYCHGCGFFIDYDKRMVGYSKEWTTTTSLTRPIEAEGLCTHCSKKGPMFAKFGNYMFCEDRCMQRWYLSLGYVGEYQHPLSCCDEKVRLLMSQKR